MQAVAGFFKLKFEAFAEGPRGRLYMAGAPRRPGAGLPAQPDKPRNKQPPVTTATVRTSYPKSPP